MNNYVSSFTYKRALFAALVSVFVLAGAAMAGTERRSASPTFTVTVEGRGRPMILIPGLTSSGKVWDSTVARYKSNYECHTLTLAGFAGEPASNPPSLERVRDEIAAYIRRKKLKQPIVVGHSLGGFMSMWLAIKEPDLVGPLVIVDSLPFFAAIQNPATTAASATPMAEQMRTAMMKPLPENERRTMQTTMSQSMVTDPAHIALITEWGVKSDVGMVAQSMYDMYTTDLRPSLPRIKVKALVIGTWIAYQQYTDKQGVERTFRDQYAGLADYRFVMSETGKHFVMYDDPKLLFKEMDAFLESEKQGKSKR
jgi:N-formylmaleamate deformylase